MACAGCLNGDANWKKTHTRQKGVCGAFIPATIVAAGGVDLATGLMSICQANGRVLVMHAEVCPGVLDLDAAHEELRRGGVKVGRNAVRRGEGSTPRRPRNSHVREEDWAPSTIAHKKSRGRDYRVSRDYGRDRYLAFQAPIRSASY